jgi:sigma-E factor negative regulatory protein RseA
MKTDNNMSPNEPQNETQNETQSGHLSERQKAQISDLADGQLRGAAFADAMALLETSSHARAVWHGLHVMGDVLRGDSAVHHTAATAANVAKDMAFLDAFRVNLAKVPQLTPVVKPFSPSAVLSNPSTSRGAVSAESVANDAFFNWKWVGGLSAAAAAVVLSWNLVGTTVTAPNGSGVQLAQSATQIAPVATQTTAGVMLRNPQLDALIAAHNQAGGSSALQMPSGFLRSATFSTDVPVTGLGAK